MRGVVASLIALMGGVIFADDSVSPMQFFKVSVRLAD